jgi:hypothetical protein
MRRAITEDGYRGSPFGMDLEDIFRSSSVLRANDLKAGLAQSC